jgi:hypothetical protein
MPPKRVQPARGSKDRRLSEPGSSPIAAAELQRRLEAATRDALERALGVALPCELNMPEFYFDGMPEAHNQI